MIYKTVRVYVDIEVDAERDIHRDEDGYWTLTEEAFDNLIKTNPFYQASNISYKILCEQDYMAGQICQLPLDHEGSHQ